MKHLLIIVLALTLMVGLTGCGSDSEKTAVNTTGPLTDEEFQAAYDNNQLEKIHFLTDAQAKQLAGFHGNYLNLTHLEQLTTAQAEAISVFRGKGLDLSGLKV